MANAKNGNVLKIRVQDIIGRYCLYVNEGNILYKNILEVFDKKDKIIIDFNGVWLTTSEFLNAGIGQLLLNYKKEILYSKLSFSIPPLKECLKETIPLVIFNCDKFYNDEEHRNKLTKAYEKLERKKISAKKKERKQLCTTTE